MKKILQKFNNFDPTDVVAIVTLVGGFILMAMKVDTVVGGITTMVAAYYFGRKASNKK